MKRPTATPLLVRKRGCDDAVQVPAIFPFRPTNHTVDVSPNFDVSVLANRKNCFT